MPRVGTERRMVRRATGAFLLPRRVARAATCFSIGVSLFQRCRVHVLPALRSEEAGSGENEMTHQGLAEHLVEVVTGRHRIDEDELDLLGGSNDEDISNGLVVGGRPFRGVPVGSGT